MWFVFLVILIVIIVYLFRDKINFSQPNIEKKKEELPYKKQKYLLSKAESNFYKVLSLAIQDKAYYICPKVRIADVIYVSSSPNRQKYFNKIKSKHIDFIICSEDYLSPLLAIELDDKSHNKNSRVNRDNFVDRALKKAELPILRFRASYSYKPEEIKEKIDMLLNTQKAQI